MTSPTPAKDDYVFTRDFLDNNRINLMHALWTKIFGYLIHPAISQSIITPVPSNPDSSPALRIADVGTGTSIWLCDVLNELRGTRPDLDVKLDGLDISFDAAPPGALLPREIELRKWDVRGDVPEDLVGVFDVVHVRFFAFVLLGEEIPDVAGRLFSMLKPGGYLQWGDPDFDSVRIEKTSPEIKTDGLTAMFKLLAVQDPRLKPTWVKQLPEILTQVGFEQVETDKNDCLPHWGYMLHECGLMIYELIGRKTKNEGMQKELGRLLPMGVEETRQGSYVTATRWTVVGRKRVV